MRNRDWIPWFYPRSDHGHCVIVEGSAKKLPLFLDSFDVGMATIVPAPQLEQYQKPRTPSRRRLHAIAARTSMRRSSRLAPRIVPVVGAAPTARRTDTSKTAPVTVRERGPSHRLGSPPFAERGAGDARLIADVETRRTTDR